MANDEKRVWGIHTMDDNLFLSKNVIAIGWKEFGDCSKLEPTREAYKSHYTNVYPDSKKGAIATSAGMLYRFVCERSVPLMERTVEYLQQYITAFHKDESPTSATTLFYVLHKGKKEPMNDETVRVRLQKYADSARKRCPEIPQKVHPHLWRHTRAMHLYQHGMDLSCVPMAWSLEFVYIPYLCLCRYAAQTGCH